MKTAILKRHKGIFATLVMAVPGGDFVLKTLDGLGIDADTIIAVATNTDPKYWAYSVLAVGYMYVSDKVGKEKETKVESVLRKVEEAEGDIRSALALIEHKSKKA